MNWLLEIEKQIFNEIEEYLKNKIKDEESKWSYDDHSLTAYEILEQINIIKQKYVK